MKAVRAGGRFLPQSTLRLRRQAQTRLSGVATGGQSDGATLRPRRAEIAAPKNRDEAQSRPPRIRAVQSVPAKAEATKEAARVGSWSSS